MLMRINYESEVTETIGITSITKPSLRIYREELFSKEEGPIQDIYTHSAYLHE